MNEILQYVITIVISLLSASGIGGIILKIVLDYKMKLKYDRVSFYDSKYFNAYNETWSAFCKCRASTNSLFRYKKNTMIAANDIYNQNSINYNNFLDILLKNSLFLTDDIYELFSEIINKLHELGNNFEKNIFEFKKINANEYLLSNEVLTNFYNEYEKLESLSDNLRISIKNELMKYQK